MTVELQPPSEPDVDELLLGFARALRAAGLHVTADRERTFLVAAATVGMGERSGVYWAGRATLTSNRTRELHDALKRRCLYHWIEHPGLARELEIVRTRLPEVSTALAEQVVTAVQRLRASGELIKPPGVAETLDWARALEAVGATRLDSEVAAATLGAALKYREDSERVRAAIDKLLTA